MNDQIKSSSRFQLSALLVPLRISVLFMILCGIIYPLVSTGAAQLLFPKQANGSLIEDSSGQVVGSELIGQNFTDQKWFQGRVSSIDNNASSSGSNNFAPSSPALLERTAASIEAWKAQNPDVPVSKLPIALITNSGSGLDPHITPQSADVQIARISKLTGVSVSELEQLVKANTEGRDLGVFGDERVNVLKLNLALSALLGG
jgi:K+-transporting ATPase ATPase C chain